MAASKPPLRLDPSTDEAPHKSSPVDTDARRRRKSSKVGAGARSPGGSTTAMATSISHLNLNLKHSTVADAQRNHLSEPQKPSSLARRSRRFAIKHKWSLPLFIMAVAGSIYGIHPGDDNPMRPFIFPSYKLPQSDPSMPAQYGKGPWDVAFIAFYTVVLTFTREFITEELLRPLAIKGGIRSRGKQSRFMEQAYTAIYFGFLGPAGIYIMRRTPMWYFNTRAMYEGFPHKTHEAPFKFYYLFQAAYWVQQAFVLVLGQEKPRKDFKELIGHHIVTLGLIGLSYRFHFTYMGLAVYITHDISDMFLATSKTLNYVHHFLEIPFFFVFAGVWIYLRHYLNLRIIWSLFTEFKTVGPYELNWETEQYKCLLSNIVTLVLLSAIQSLNLVWLYWIVRVPYRFFRYRVVEDDRSEAEESELENNNADGSASKRT